LRFLAGAAAAAAAIYLPFFLASPAGMVREVVLDQLGRPRDVVHTPFKRISSFLGATGLHLREPWAAVLSPNKLGLLLLIGVIVCATAALTVKGARLYPAG